MCYLSTCDAARRRRHPTFGLRKRGLLPLYMISIVLKAPGPPVTLIYISTQIRAFHPLVALIIYLLIFALSTLVLCTRDRFPRLSFSIRTQMRTYIYFRAKQTIIHHIKAQEGNRRQVYSPSPPLYNPLERIFAYDNRALTVSHVRELLYSLPYHPT